MERTYTENIFMKKCIVTGGAGFIGSHLVDLLLENGYQVTVLDNFSTGRPENLDHQTGNKNLNLVEADIVDTEKIKPYFKDVEYVFHLAALADIVPSITNPISYYRSNVMGTMSVLEAARLNKAKKFVYAASSSCYGIPDKYPTPEDSEIRTEYPYALTKYLGEQTLLHWSKVYDLPFISLRLFNVYGTRSRTSGTYGAVFGVFLAQKLNNKPFTVVGDGTQTRDFIYVTDVAAAFSAAATPAGKNLLLHFWSGEPNSINKLVELLKGEVTYIPKRPGEPDCTHADVTKISDILKWKPKITFEQGVKKVLQNIDYWKNAPVWTPEKIEEKTKDWFQYLGK
jgi:UDP-glucose 4-epimerase